MEMFSLTNSEIGMRIGEFFSGKDFKFSEKATVVLLKGGSDRKFYRISEKDESVIVMEGEGDEKEFGYYIAIRNYLEKMDLGVPQLFSVDREKRVVMMEDLGDLSLQSIVLRKFAGAGLILKQVQDAPTSWEGEAEIYELYCKVIDYLIALQIEGSERIGECGMRIAEFGYEDFRWETQYFKEEFLKRYCRLIIREEEKLDSEFHELANKLINEPLYFMHRDFQSQNIFIKDEKVRITDFQSARRGLIAYDLVSVLKDCYVVLSHNVRERLLDYYMDQFKANSGKELRLFKSIFHYTGLQRNMQALGAFSHLTLVKKKVEFEQYIPAGVEYLRQSLKDVGEFPVLRSIIEDVSVLNL
jgi:aminoglycoside/choline kinase family phosphotransferase